METSGLIRKAINIGPFSILSIGSAVYGFSIIGVKMETKVDHWSTVLKRKIFDGIETVMFAKRLILVVFYLAMVSVMVVYCWTIMKESVSMVVTNMVKGDIDKEALLIQALSLIDIVMIANLVEQVTTGSYMIFVRKFRKDHQLGPQWTQHITPGSLKVKISMSVVGVSMIHLLKYMVDATLGSSGWDIVLPKMAIHIVFVASMMATAFTDKLIEPPAHEHEPKKGEAHE
jgi:uncharacterized protein (TIGR00645 family)